MAFFILFFNKKINIFEAGKTGRPLIFAAANLSTLRRILSILLVSVASIQFLPLKEVGALLFKNQLVEELPHQGADQVQKEIKSKFNCNSQSPFLPLVIAMESTLAIHHSANIPPFPWVEILSPPPNG